MDEEGRRISDCLESLDDRFLDGLITVQVSVILCETSFFVRQDFSDLFSMYSVAHSVVSNFQTFVVDNCTFCVIRK